MADPTVCEICGALADGESGRCHLHFRAADPVPPPAAPGLRTLDEAWAEAEAALPGKDWLLEVVHRGAVKGDINPHTGYPVLAPTLRYTANAGRAWNPLGIDPPDFECEGDTPAAALRALVRVLAETPGEPQP